MAIATAYVPTSMPSGQVWYGDLLVANSSTIIISDGFRETEYFGSFSYSSFGEVFGTLEVVNEYRGGTLIYSVTDINADARQIYQAVQILANFELSASIVLASGDTLNGSSGDDILRSYAGNDFVYGLGGNDVLDGMSGNDLIDGGAGIDTSVYSGNQASYTLTLSPTATSITDRRLDGNGTDQLIDIEFLDFDTEAFPFDFNLTQFGGTTGLSGQDFESFIELYIAYFNRAPDAVGLNFWGTAFANGTSLEEMATLFVDQDETLAAYPSGTSNIVFAETVYNNVLGRTPDQAGFDFWVGQLDSDSVSRDQFILEVLRGVQPGTPDESYLDTKVDIGAYFAVHRGMSDTDNASAAMALFDGTQASVDTAVAAIDGYYADASDLDGEFLLQVVGVLDDPFSDVKNNYTTLSTYIFGHSLIDHTSSSSETNVPVWMSAMAKAAEFDYAVDGQFGFLRSHAEFPVRPNWGYEGVTSAWDAAGATSFADANYDTILLTAANFIQYQSATSPYDGDNPDNISPLSATLEIIDWVGDQEPGIAIYIYEPWPDMASFMSSGLDAYNNYTQNEFHQWWVDYYNLITDARPDIDVQLIPVGSTIAKLLSETALSEIPVGELYEDDAPHGRPTVYFLASLVTYTAMYGERPPADFVIPDTVHSLVRENYAQIVEIVWNEVGTGHAPLTANSDDPVYILPDALDDDASTVEDSSVLIDVLGNDSDQDGDARTISEPYNAGNGTVIVEGDQIRHTPDAGFSGEDSFSYAMSDGADGTNVAILTVTVAPVEATPTDPGDPTVRADTTDTTAQGLTNPSLGMGLSGITDWSVQQPFIDVMKTARPWIGHLSNQWGGWEAADLEAGGYLDENGWLTSIPSDVTAIEAIILTSLPAEAISTGGRYRVTYDGEGTLQIVGSVSNVQYNDGEIWFDYTPDGSASVAVNISETDPNGSGNYLRNIFVVHENNIELFEAGATFNPVWFDIIKDMRSLRFMDWMATNWSEESSFEDAPTESYYTYHSFAGGSPMEVMVALANEAGIDPWFNMPHMATDEYIRQFAEYVRDNLDPDLKAHVEYSNELWNWQFSQTQWAQEQADIRWGTDAPSEASWIEFAGMRAAQMTIIWGDVFGAEADNRVVSVIATQSDWPGLERALLEASLWVAEDPVNNQPPGTYFDAYAVTGYFGIELGNAQSGQVHQWIADSQAATEADASGRGLSGAVWDAYVGEHRFDLASTLAADSLFNGSLGELVGEIFPYHASVAEQWGLDLIMYEGGTHVVGVDENVNDPELTEFYNHFNYTTEMADLYQILLEGWQDSGGTLFNQFVDIADASQWGSWGSLRNLEDENPRFDTLNAFNTDTKAWWETRDTDTFDHGVALFGTDGADTLTGTAEEDYLIGGNGDDILISNGGSDGLHGGDGVDTAVYRFDIDDYTLTISPTGVTIADRFSLISVGGDGTDQLIDIEVLEFGGGVELNLTQFSGTTGLSGQDFESFIELYIAYFNRAPDAVGLNFWGTAFANGTTLEEIATQFIDQDETRTTYPASLSNADFATEVYNNVLGRIPDQAGFDFWVGILDSGDRGRDQFILSVLQGVQDGSPDQAYLSNKIDIGAYFAVHRGMSDVDNASAAMALFDGTQAGIDNAVSAIDGFYADALDPSNGEFLMQVVGVLDDPFAVA